MSDLNLQALRLTNAELESRVWLRQEGTDRYSPMVGGMWWPGCYREGKPEAEIVVGEYRLEGDVWRIKWLS